MNAKRTSILGLGGRVLEAMPDMLLLCDGEANVVDVLHPKAELVGLPAEKLIGANLARPEIAPIVDNRPDRIRAVCETGACERFAFRHAADGLAHHYEVFLSKIGEDRVLANIRTIHRDSVARIESEHLHYFFAQVLDNLAIPTAVKSMDTERYVFWSRKAEVFSRTATEMVGATEDLFMPPEKAREVQRIDRELARGPERRYQGVEKYTTVDGREHTFIVTRTLFFFGEEKLILCSALDISELKETQASLLRTKDELARKNLTLCSVLSLAKVIPWSCDLETGVFFCDWNAYHPEGAAGPDEEGRYVISMERYFDGIHADYREEAIKLIDDLASGRREEFHETYLVHWFNDRDWDWVRVQSSVAERDADGRPVRLIGSAQRITDQKRTELALREAKEDLAVKNATLSSVLTVAQVIPWECDLEKGVFSCDYEAYHHRSAPAAEVDGRYRVSAIEYFDRIHPDYRTEAFERYLDLIEGRTREYHEVYPIHWYDDREYEWVETQSTVTRCDAEGTPLCLIGSARVVTHQKRMEDSLRIAKEQAEESNRLKSAFLANMSHEIRTPLNAIVGFSELLAQADDAQEKEEYLSIIKNSNALLLQLIGDILDLAKIEAGTLEFTFADYDLTALMEELEQTARVKMTDPALEVACRDTLPGCTIHTDRGRLMQVLHNFINNAAKFTREGHIHFGFRPRSDGRWYFYVEDTGCGIPEEVQDEVFGRFVKLDRQAKGTGLGLAISKSIVERLGGEIGVTSVEGKGSTFWFVLPADAVRTSAPCPVAAEPAGPPCVEAPLRTVVLVAEDDASNYKLFEAMLRKHYTLLHAWNGREAVEMYREYRPSVILMDIKMPEMDGYAATAQIRKLSSDVPIIAVTAFAYPEDMRRILESGFDGCLPKPVNADTLKNKISELFR